MITKDDAFLLVYLSNESIICNHSNQVSWLQDMRKIEHFCQRPVGKSLPDYIVRTVISCVRNSESHNAS